MKKALIVVVIGLFFSTLFFFLSDIQTLIEYDMTYIEYIKEVSLIDWLSWVSRYFLAYPAMAIAIIIYLLKEHKNSK